MKSLLKRKNYEVHAISTLMPGDPPRYNANIATWVMQSAMGGKEVVVALYGIDYTLELVKQSRLLNINLLQENQTNLISALGRKSGRDHDKLRPKWYALDSRGCPYLVDAVGYIQTSVKEMVEGLDHTLCICQVDKQIVLNPDAPVMTHHYLRAKGLVRG
ncbi:MAG: flavin reductase family protein [Spirosomataceae bacterium]